MVAGLQAGQAAEPLAGAPQQARPLLVGWFWRGDGHGADLVADLVRKCIVIALLLFFLLHGNKLYNVLVAFFGSFGSGGSIYKVILELRVEVGGATGLKQNILKMPDWIEVSTVVRDWYCSSSVYSLSLVREKEARLGRADSCG